MSQIISDSSAEYICPNCNKKSNFSSVLPTNGTFKISCYYCNYISDAVYEKLPTEPQNNILDTDSSIEAYIEEIPFHEFVNEKKQENKEERKIDSSLTQRIEIKEELKTNLNILDTIAGILGFSKKIVKREETLPFIEKKVE